MFKTTLAIALLAFGVAIVPGQAAPLEGYLLYSFTATIKNTVTLTGGSEDPLTYTAGDSISGSFIIDRYAANTSTWAYPGEVALFANALEAFSFDDFWGNAGSLPDTGNVQVHDGRRLVQGGSPECDVFVGSMSSGSYSATELENGIASFAYNLSTHAYGTNPAAINGLALPLALTPSSFDAVNTVELTFASGDKVEASFTSFAVTPTNVSTVPEPSTAALLLGAAGFVMNRRRRAHA